MPDDNQQLKNECAKIESLLRQWAIKENDGLKFESIAKFLVDNGVRVL